jgi:hypothetical protein
MTTLKIPRNEAGIALTRQIASRQRDRRQGNSERSRIARARFRAALLENHLRKAEAKIVEETTAVQKSERDVLFEAASRVRRGPVRPSRYVVEAIYERKQERLNELLIDDRHHPRYSHPTPMILPDVVQSHSCASSVVSENRAPRMTLFTKYDLNEQFLRVFPGHHIEPPCAATICVRVLVAAADRSSTTPVHTGDCRVDALSSATFIVWDGSIP